MLIGQRQSQNCINFAQASYYHYNQEMRNLKLFRKSRTDEAKIEDHRRVAH